MKTAQEYFDEYAISHQNKTNQTIHYICVPLIFFSIIGLLLSIHVSNLLRSFDLYNPLLENWAVVVGVFVLLFYLRLGFWYFAEMLLIILISIAGNYWLSSFGNLFYISLTIFVISWIGQFYGHKIEGAKPSFLNDLKFLLIGPLWVIQKLSKK
ncbi:MAG: DUF962 domain-containing protein [Flavobacteriaceae bacterium]|nr:DUF962 domain-containing protein [Flavobacteriaceae bacterium]